MYILKIVAIMYLLCVVIRHNRRLFGIRCAVSGRIGHANIVSMPMRLVHDICGEVLRDNSI